MRQFFVVLFMVSMASLTWAQERRRFPEPEPTATDEIGQVMAKVCRWHDDKTAAVALRFDDSDPSHIHIVIPLLTQHKIVGTFLINPGTQDYQEHKAEWEAVAAQGLHEFGNHTYHHRGAKDDEEADREIGECSKYIWGLFPKKSKLLAFRSGGGTTWNITKPWNYYMEKWHLVHDPNSAGIAMRGKPYISNMAMFEERLKRAMEDRDCVTFCYHQVHKEKGPGISEEFFRQQVKCLDSHRNELWFAGVAQMVKYREERRKATIAIKKVSPDKIQIELACGTEPELYDEPLTVQVTLPEGWDAKRANVKHASGKNLTVRPVPSAGANVIRFETPPVGSTITLLKTSGQ